MEGVLLRIKEFGECPVGITSLGDRGQVRILGAPTAVPECIASTLKNLDKHLSPKFKGVVQRPV